MSTTQTPEPVDTAQVPTDIPEAQPLAVRPEGSKITTEEIQESYGLTDSEYFTLLRTVCKDAPRPIAAMFLLTCKRRGLDPFAKQVYLWPDKTNDDGTPRSGCSWNIVTSIGGLRAIASRSPYYRGRSKKQMEFARDEHGAILLFKKDDSQYGKIAGKRIPTDCTISVYRAIPQAPTNPELYMEFESHIRFDEYVKLNRGEKIFGNWEVQPEHQFEKCCEADALRMAFPEEVGGLYIEEEMRDARIVNVEPAAPVEFSPEILDLAKRANWPEGMLASQAKRLGNDRNLLDLLTKTVERMESSARGRGKGPKVVTPAETIEHVPEEDEMHRDLADEVLAKYDATPGSLQPKTRATLFAALGRRGITEKKDRLGFAKEYDVDVASYAALSERQGQVLVRVLTTVDEETGELRDRVLGVRCEACHALQEAAHAAGCPLDENNLVDEDERDDLDPDAGDQAQEPRLL